MSTPRMMRGLLSFSSMTMVSRVLGLIRDQAISTTFGANAVTDAFWVAFRIRTSCGACSPKARSPPPSCRCSPRSRRPGRTPTCAN